MPVASFVSGSSSSASQRVAHAREKFIHGAFAQIAMSALIQQSLNLSLIVIESRVKEDARFGLILVQWFEERSAILACQIEVQNNKIEFGSARFKHGLGRVCGGGDLESGLSEKAAYDQPPIRVIVHE